MGNFLTSDKSVIRLLTGLNCIVAGACLMLELKVKEPGVLLLAFVTIGTGIDFTGSLIGDYVKNEKLLLLYTKLRFSLLNFGILFTPLCAAYVLQYFPSASICRALFSQFPLLLILSLITGGLFMFSHYVKDDAKGETGYTLDRGDKFTKCAFIIRKVVLLCSLIIAIVVVVEGIKTEMALWSLLFGVVFVATVPLHIFYKQLSSMAAELATLVIILFGAGKVLL